MKGKTMAYTNRDIVPLAMRGQTGSTPSGNFSTRSTPNGIARGGYKTGYLPSALRHVMRDRADSIVQVIYSYDTPIAWLDAGAWIIPDVTYSATTSQKHQSQLYRLHGIRHVPFDATTEDIVRILNGLMYYARENKRYYGTGKGIA